MDRENEVHSGLVAGYPVTHSIFSQSTRALATELGLPDMASLLDTVDFAIDRQLHWDWMLRMAL